jgi:tetratricopeptide (TPR) repeat protein
LHPGWGIRIDGIPVFAFTRDGRRLAVAEGQTVRVYALPELARSVATFPREKSFDSLAFSADGNALFAMSGGSNRAAWDVESGRPLPLAGWRGVAAAPTPAAPRRGAPSAPWGGKWPDVNLWDANTGEPVPSGEFDTLVDGGPGGASPPLPGDPALLTLWVQLLTGQELDVRGATRLLGVTEWADRRQRFRTVAGHSHTDYARESDHDAWYTQLLALDPNGDDPYLWHLDRLIEAYPDDSESRLSRAFQLAGKGRLDAAVADCRAYLPRFPQNPDGRNSFVNLLAAVGLREEALATCLAILRAEPNDSVAMHNLIMLRLAAGDIERLHQDSEACLRKIGEARDPELANNAAWLAAPVPDAVGDIPHCLRMARVAVAGKRVHQTLNTLGAVLYRAGQFEDAVGTLNEAIGPERKSYLVSDWAFLAMAHDRLGHRDQAEKALDQAILTWRRQTRTWQSWLSSDVENDALVHEAVLQVLERRPAYLPVDVFQKSTR